MKNFIISKNDHIVKKFVNDEKKVAPLNSSRQYLDKNKLPWRPGHILDKYRLSQIS